MHYTIHLYNGLFFLYQKAFTLVLFIKIAFANSQHENTGGFVLF